MYSDAFTAPWRCDLGSGHATVKQHRYYEEFMMDTLSFLNNNAVNGTERK